MLRPFRVVGADGDPSGAADKDLALRGGLEPLVRTINGEVDIRITNDSYGA